MKNYKTIYEILESWGRGKRKLPPNNEALKSKILSKLPAHSSLPSPYRHPRKSPFIFVPFAFTALALVILLVNVNDSPNYQDTAPDSAGTKIFTSNKSSTPPDSSTSTLGSAQSDSIMPMPPIYRREEVSIYDTREFLKQSYYATIRTRHINEAQTRVEIIVRGMGGRVDSSSGGEKNGYVSFAIPKDRLEAFRIGIKDLVGARFYEEQTSSENLLPQKQNIEEREREMEKNISSLKSERAGVVKNHNQINSLYQNSINATQTEMAALNYEYQSATYPRRIEIENKLRELQGKINALQSDVLRENKNYSSKINNIDAQIRYSEENLKIIQREDKNLLENVATVNGSISLQKINVWEMADIYVPGPLIAWMLFFAAVLSFLWHRRSVEVSYDF